MRYGDRGIVLLLLMVMLFALSVTGIVALMGSNIDEGDRQQKTAAAVEEVYRAVVGDPARNTFGYLGDVGDYPESLTDLTVKPASNPAGWNGPYIRDIPLVDGMVTGYFGAPLEYFLDVAAGSPDRLAIISRGPDRDSTNPAYNPNVAVQFAGLLPDDPAYIGGNSDNIVFPYSYEDPNVLNYENTGTLAYQIQNKDTNPALNSVVNACPGLYTLNMTSVPRGSADTVGFKYSPGNQHGLVQGAYRVDVASKMAVNPVWTDAVDLHSGQTTTRSILASQYNSATTPAFTLTVYNESTGAYAKTLNVRLLKANGTSLGNITTGAPIKTFSARACSVIVLENSGVVYDTFVMPYGNYTRYVQNPPAGSPQPPYTLTVTNGGTQTDHLMIFDTNDLLVGTVYKRKSGTFTIPSNPAPNSPQVSGTTIKFVKRDGTTQISSMTLSGDMTLTIP